MLRYKLNIGWIGCVNRELDRLGPIGYSGPVCKLVRNKKPDQCVNREAIRLIFREGIYLGVSVELS